MAGLQRPSREVGRLQRATTRGAATEPRVAVRPKQRGDCVACPLRTGIVLCRDEAVYVVPMLQNHQCEVLYYIIVGSNKSPNDSGGARIVAEVWRP